MRRSSAKPSSASPSIEVVAERSTHPASAAPTAGLVASGAALLAIAVWLGGLVALGAIAAPVVFAIVPFPASADAMTVVFRRFDTVSLVCSAVVLTSEAARAAAGLRFAAIDHARALASLLAAAAASAQAVLISPRIAALHAAGVQRGGGAAGLELARLHDRAELCGKTELLLLACAVLLHVAAVGRVRVRAAGRGVA